METINYSKISAIQLAIKEKNMTIFQDFFDECLYIRQRVYLKHKEEFKPAHYDTLVSICNTEFYLSVLGYNEKNKYSFYSYYNHMVERRVVQYKKKTKIIEAEDYLYDSSIYDEVTSVIQKNSIDEYYKHATYDDKAKMTVLEKYTKDIKPLTKSIIEDIYIKEKTVRELSNELQISYQGVESYIKKYKRKIQKGKRDYELIPTEAYDTALPENKEYYSTREYIRPYRRYVNTLDNFDINDISADIAYNKMESDNGRLSLLQNRIKIRLSTIQRSSLLYGMGEHLQPLYYCCILKSMEYKTFLHSMHRLGIEYKESYLDELGKFLLKNIAVDRMCKNDIRSKPACGVIGLSIEDHARYKDSIKTPYQVIDSKSYGNMKDIVRMYILLADHKMDSDNNHYKIMYINEKCRGDKRFDKSDTAVKKLAMYNKDASYEKEYRKLYLINYLYNNTELSTDKILEIMNSKYEWDKIYSKVSQIFGNGTQGVKK